jgi:acetyl-CoA C-acetyltransferase
MSAAGSRQTNSVVLGSWRSERTMNVLDGAVYVVGYARTPFGRFGGALKTVDLPHLGAAAVMAALERASVTPEQIDEVAFGVNFPGGDRSIARQVQLHAGIPDDKASYSVDRACCSSLAAITLASRGLRLGDTRYAVAGGVENLSRVPYFIEEARFGQRLGDIVLTDQLVVSCPYTGVPRAVQASDEAATYGVGRSEQDEWACRSQEAYAAALATGFFDDEIAPFSWEGPDGTTVALDHDEPPRPDTSVAALGRLRTVNGSSTVTAGNAPDLSSGASALVLAGDASDPGVQPLARLEGWSMAAGDPQHIASMPAVAGRLALQRTGLQLDDIDVIEINEAFAAVPLVSTLVLASGDPVEAKRLRDRTNMNGGAVAIGHPTGATAGRLVMTTINQLRRAGGGTGLVCICGGVGEAEAVVVRVSDLQA